MTSGADPLIDSIFRPTSLSDSIASALPVRVTGTRSRAGNAMSRTRSALLDGARRAVETNGTKITMSQVAAAAGVAKATLYNHFRTREAVLSALLDAQVAGLLALIDPTDPLASLDLLARRIGENGMLRALARVEPATLAAIARIDESVPAWRSAHDAVARLLAAQELGGADTVLRWLASFIVSPGGPVTVAADLTALVHGLPPATATAQTA